MEIQNFKEMFPWLNVLSESSKPYTDYTDEELLDVLQRHPDFQKFVFPTTWHKKFPNLPKAECSNTKEFVRESPWTKRAYHFYENGGRIENIPAKEGGVRPVLPAPEVPTMTLIENSFSDKPIDQTVSSDQLSSPGLKVNSITTIETKSQE